MALQSRIHELTDFSHTTHTSCNAYPREPLVTSGALDGFKSEETTPLIGREFFDVDLVKDILESENADAMIRDLAITSEWDLTK